MNMVFDVAGVFAVVYGTGKAGYGTMDLDSVQEALLAERFVWARAR